MHHVMLLSEEHREILVNKDRLVLEVLQALRLALNGITMVIVTNFFHRVTVVTLVLEEMMVLKEIKDHPVTRDHLVTGVIQYVLKFYFSTFYVHLTTLGSSWRERP